MTSAFCRNAMGKREPNGLCRGLRTLLPPRLWRICVISRGAAMSFMEMRPVVSRSSWTTPVVLSSAPRQINPESRMGAWIGRTGKP